MENDFQKNPAYKNVNSSQIIRINNIDHTSAQIFYINYSRNNSLQTLKYI